MKRKERLEFYLCLVCCAFLIGILNIAYFGSQQHSFFLNGASYSEIGVIKYLNPSDGKTVYFPIYEKR